MTSQRRWRPVYRLQPNESDYCRQLALVRNNTKLGKIPDHRVDRRASSLEVNYLHVQALYAVARLLGTALPTERDLAPIKSTSYLSYADWKVVVRFNQTREGDFYFARGFDFVTDAGVLCYTAPLAKWPEPNLPGIQVAGWLTRDDWNEYAGPRDYGFGPVRSVLQSHLRDFRELEQREKQLNAPVQAGFSLGGTMTQASQLKKDRQLLKTIETFIRDHGFSPSLREMKDLENYSSTSMVQRALDRLEKVGAIAGRRPGTARTIVVLDGGFAEG